MAKSFKVRNKAVQSKILKWTTYKIALKFNWSNTTFNTTADSGRDKKHSCCCLT